MSEVFWRDAASGSLIDPAMIPGTDIDGAVLSGVAAGFRDRGGLLVERAEVVLGDWGGLAPVYSAPEAPVLLAAMDPIRADVGVTAEKLAKAADRIDDLAGLVAAPVRRLRELKAEAEEFVASVRGGVTVSGTDPDNPYYQAMMMTEGSAMGMAMAPEGHNSATINWSEHTPSVNRNNELIEQVNNEFVRIHNAVAECVNGITALIDGYCAPGMSTISDAQLAAMTETDYGSIGKGDRSCSESVGDGALQAGTDMFAGIVSLGGGSFDDEWNWSHSGETASAAWSGMLQGLGAIAMVGVPSVVLTVTPDEALPGGLRAVKDWHAQQMTGLVEGIVGDPEMWAEDPVAAGAFAVTNIGSFFIPVAGGAAAAGKVGTVAARAGLSTVRLGTRLDGVVSSSVVVNVGDLMARAGNTLTDLGRGSSAASRAELAGVLEAFEQTRLARNELSPPVGFGERMNAAVEHAAQFPARASEAMQHLGDRLGLHGGGGLLPAFADGVPGRGHRFDVEVPTRDLPGGTRVLDDERPASPVPGLDLRGGGTASPPNVPPHTNLHEPPLHQAADAPPLPYPEFDRINAEYRLIDGEVDPARLHEWAAEMSNAYPAVTPSQVLAIYEYTTMDGYRMIDYLRDRGSGEIDLAMEARIDEASQGIANLPAAPSYGAAEARSGSFYHRGVGLDEAFLAQFTEGANWTDPSFASSSSLESVARGFALREGAQSGRTPGVLTFDALTVADVTPFSRFGYEAEYLFQRNAQFEVVSKMQDENGMWRIHLRETIR